MSHARALAAAALIALAISSTQAAEIVGRAIVIEGDTLAIEGARIRLHGIDAPERDQLCGRSGKVLLYGCGDAAAYALSDWIGARNVSCEEKGKDRDGQSVAVCKVGGEEVSRWLVAKGHALADRRHGGDAYDREERIARAARRGIWGGRFTPPWEWRHNRGGEQTVEGPSEADLKRAGPPTARRIAEATGCRIKGDINVKGEKVYHTPESPNYAQIRINLRKGERMFCTAADAETAGWRAAN